jgi:hypothetical protein
MNGDRIPNEVMKSGRKMPKRETEIKMEKKRLGKCHTEGKKVHGKKLRNSCRKTETDKEGLAVSPSKVEMSYKE